MTARQKKATEGEQPKAPRRERRAFTEEFRREALRLIHEWRAQGVTATQVGRELDVRPDPLREWAPWLAEREGGLAAAGAVVTPERELTRPRRENALPKAEREFEKRVGMYFARESR